AGCEVWPLVREGFSDSTVRRPCGHDTTPRGVTGLTHAARPAQFRCDINGLEAESVKLNEEFSPNCGALWHSRRNNPTRQPHRAGIQVRARRLKLMTRRTCTAFQQRLAASTAILSVALGATLSSTAFAAAGDYPITGQQRETAQKVAEAGVPLSELAPNAPDSYTVKTGDTLWDISKLYLRSPWRWPELWGMNLEQIRNPHLIYPGQVLVLEKTAGRARLRLAQPAGEPPSGTVKLSPHVRPSPLDSGAIASIPFHLIEPFLNEAVIFQGNELLSAPRIVATQEGRVLLSRGDTAYVRGEIGSNTAFRIFREAKPLKDPTTAEVLGWEAAYVGAAEAVRPGETRTADNGKAEIVPATFTVTSIRQEANVGDRLAPVPQREFSNYAPHAPAAPMAGQIVALYGDALT